MKVIHRKIDFQKDKDYVLERHCRINYECDCPWKRKMSYDEYREEWFSLKSQVNGFYEHLQETARDNRTIAVILEAENNDIIGYLWVPFYEDSESGFRFADIQDIYIEEGFRNNGIANDLLAFAENEARKNGAKVIRSGTGCENLKSIKLHKKLGFYQYRYEFEKEL